MELWNSIWEANLDTLDTIASSFEQKKTKVEFVVSLEAI